MIALFLLYSKVHFICLKVYIIYFLLCLSLTVVAQKGEYFVKNYSPKDYNSGANNSNICQDKDGNILIANSNGILIFDGYNWILTPSRFESYVYSVYKSSDQTIYYAIGEGETLDFGVFEKNTTGKYIYYSLKNSLSSNEMPFEPIRQIIECNNALYFIATDKIIEYKNKKLKSYSPINSFNSRAFKMGNHLFVPDIDNQVFVIDGGALKPVKNSQNAAENKAFFNYQINDTTYALGYRNIGIVIATYNAKEPTHTQFKKLNVAFDNELIESEINNGTALSNGHFVVTTNKSGAIILNKQLQIIKRLTTKAGLFENNIKSAFEDQNGNLWLANYYGVSYVEINTPLLKYGRENGITGSVQAACYFNKQLYIGTDKGLFVYDTITNGFINVLDFNKQTWYLLNFKNHLLVCTTRGIYTFDGKNINQSTEDQTRYLQNDPFQSNIIYASTNNGFNVYEIKDLKFILQKEYHLGHEVKNISYDYNQNIYFSTELNGIYYLNSKKSYSLDSIKSEQGLPNDKWENYVFNYKNKLLIGTEAGIYSVSEDKNNRLFCKKDPTFYSLTKKSEIFRAVALGGDLLCSKNEKASDYDKYETKYVYYKETPNNTIIEDNRGIRKLKDVKPNLINYDTSYKTILISADEGLFLLHQDYVMQNKIYHLNLNLLTNKKSDTLLLNTNSGAALSTLNLEVPYEDNNLQFRFGYTCFEFPEITDFSYYLEGKDNGYSKWGKKSEIEFNNLFEGNYVLHVKTKNEISNQVLEMHIPFTIIAPWYRSVFAYIVYAIIFILFIYIIVRLNTKRLKAQNIKLEEIIKQRTATIEEQVHLLEHQKKEITDSINYAKGIQASILPDISSIISSWRDLFVFFQPKDIVSGDFYWYKKISEDEFLIACADCTGHGVPGGFMSMICSDKLHDAAKNSKEPAQILFDANNGVKTTLKQEIVAEGKSKDGMEVCLLYVNTKTQEVKFSGANRILWIIDGDTKELKEIKPTKASIASFTEFNFEYEQHHFKLKKGDMIYTTTDGFPDQFGGADGRKYMSKNMKKFIVSICNKPMQEQAELIKNEINNWMQAVEQVDDLLVIGIRL